MRAIKRGSLKGRGTLVSTVAVLAPLMIAVSPASAEAVTAQTNAQSPSDEMREIIVTARKRNETYISVPVSITPVSADELSRRSITRVEDLAKVVPSLALSPQDNNQQGGAVSIRGIAGVYQNPQSDQPVAFNIDGVQVARASVKRLGDFDLDNIQVLEGPQALYYGKNSPAGIVVINSANPTKHFEAGASLSYEPYGHEWREEGFVSGPISDELGYRIAAYGDQLGGWIKDVATPNAGFGSLPFKLPHDREYGGRLTLTYRPSDVFNARLKVVADNLDNAGFHENDQFTWCPGLHMQFGGPDTCVAGETNQIANMGPNFYKLFGSPFRPDGVPEMNVQQYLAGLEMNYNVTPGLTLSSLTGYYESDLDGTSPFNSVDSTAVNLMIGGRAQLDIKEISQEVRLTSSFKGPLNFMIGAFYQHSSTMNAVTAGLNANAPFVIAATRFNQTGNAPSVFGSLSYKPADELELSGGARVSWETKSIYCHNSLTNALCNLQFPQGTADPRHTWRNVSPEATAT